MREALFDDIKFNCDVSDATHWGYFSICGLLMRYRDLFRSEQGLDPWDEIGRDPIAEWIRKKEERWPDLEGQDFRHLTIGGQRYGPFEVDRINDALQPDGLVYGAGYGMYLKPTFFLADLQRRSGIAGHRVWITGRERVRDLFTTSGMLQDRTIFIRLEQLSVLLWERFQYAGKQPGGRLSAVFARYGMTPSAGTAVLTASLQRVVEQHAEVLIRHELAESLEGIPEWHDMLTVIEDRSVEQFMRAVQDLVADTSDHGPIAWLREARDADGLSLMVSLMDGYRRLLFPEIRSAVDALHGSVDWTAVEHARQNGLHAFRSLRQEVVGLFRSDHGPARRLQQARDLVREAVERSAPSPVRACSPDGNGDIA